jgi:hypothetical protein
MIVGCSNQFSMFPKIKIKVNISINTDVNREIIPIKMDNIDETSSSLSKKRKRKTTTKQSVSDLNQVKHSNRMKIYKAIITKVLEEIKEDNNNTMKTSLRLIIELMMSSITKFILVELIQRRIILLLNLQEIPKYFSNLKKNLDLNFKNI